MGTAEEGGCFTARKHALQARPFLYGRVRFTFDSCVPQISHNLFRLVASIRAPATPSNGAPSNHQSTHQEQHRQHGGYLDGAGSDGENSPGL